MRFLKKLVQVKRDSNLSKKRGMMKREPLMMRSRKRNCSGKLTRPLGARRKKKCLKMITRIVQKIRARKSIC